MLNHEIPFTLHEMEAATFEPITVEEVKLQSRIDSDVETPLLEGYIRTAREMVESDARLSLCSRKWRLSIDQFPTCFSWHDRSVIRLYKAPCLSVESVKYIDMAGTLQTLPVDQYKVDLNAPARIEPAWGTFWPPARREIAAVQVEFTAGFSSPTEIPEMARHAVLMLAAAWYCRPDTAGDMSDCSTAYNAIISRLRYSL